MSTKIINFIKGVINKKFSTKAKGYDPDEVDNTLDSIFEEFSSYIEQYDKLNEEYAKLKKDYDINFKKLTELETQNQVLISKLNQLESSGVSFNMLNERLNEIEQRIDDKDKKKIK